jgi:hypothetical protein
MAHGSEPSFTLIQNFLLTGVLATIVGLLLTIWALRFIHRRHGATIFLLLSDFISCRRRTGPVSALYTQLGGHYAHFGIARILAMVYAVALEACTRPLLAMGPGSGGRILPCSSADRHVRLFPSASPRDTQILHRTLIQLGAAISLAFLFSIICAFAYDIEARSRPAQGRAAV